MPNPDADAESGINALIPRFVMFILDNLICAGHRAFIVGGAVRDICLCRPVTDWDVATSASSAEIKSIFRNVRRFDLKKGTVTLVHAGRHFDVTPFRGPANRLRDDLERRDFTMNAMALDVAGGRIVDYRNGRKDIGRARIRATGNPESRFREDPLRILRAVRFASELGFRIHTETLDAMTRMTGLLKNTAPERVREEFMRILLCPKPSAGFSLLRRTGILAVILPELLEGYLKRQNRHHRYTIFRHVMETVDRTPPIAVQRLTALFHDIAKPRVRQKVNGMWHFRGHEAAGAEMTVEIMRRLRFSRERIRQVSNLVRHHGIDYDPVWTDGAVRRLIRRVGPEQIGDLLDFRHADILAHGLHRGKIRLLNELRERVRGLSDPRTGSSLPRLAVNGKNVMEILGIPPGPEVGRILNDLFEKITDDPGLNTKAGLTAALERMKTRIQTGIRP